jgi:hypothetical protein
MSLAEGPAGAKAAVLDAPLLRVLKEISRLLRLLEVLEAAALAPVDVPGDNHPMPVATCAFVRAALPVATRAVHSGRAARGSRS